MQVEVPRLQSDRRQPTEMGRETMAFVAGGGEFFVLEWHYWIRTFGEFFFFGARAELSR